MKIVWRIKVEIIVNESSQLNTIDNLLNFNFQGFELRSWNESNSISELTNLVRTAYKSLLEKGFRYWGTFQSEEDTLKRISDRSCYVLWNGTSMVGTVTLAEVHHGPEYCAWYNKPEVCFFTQFAIDPKHQGSGLGSKLMTFIEDEARRRGFKEIALDTAENAHSLINYYMR